MQALTIGFATGVGVSVRASSTGFGARRALQQSGCDNRASHGGVGALGFATLWLHQSANEIRSCSCSQEQRPHYAIANMSRLCMASRNASRCSLLIMIVSLNSYHVRKLTVRHSHPHAPKPLTHPQLKVPNKL
jgi:hypothetical protein